MFQEAPVNKMVDVAEAEAEAVLQVQTAPAAHETLLYLDGVSVSFDGFKALNELSLYVTAGEMRAIIGPNGAGKTTMMDVITGKTRPDTGTVLFRGDVDLTRRDEADIARLGIGRKFQKPTVFESHTVYHNLEMALKAPRGVFDTLFHRLKSEQAARIAEILEIIRLTGSEERLAGALSHGQKQWLEIGMLLMQEPDLLLVDEPVAGMTDAETERTAELLRHIAQTRSVIVVEHDMEFVRALGVKVTVLHEGSVLSEGSLEHVQADQRVVEVYLGR
jgi:urea transport system ATP-binding protein